MAAGATPPGYNPDVSLLNTGSSVQIQAVRGGGQKGGDGEPRYAEYLVEVYQPEVEMIQLPALPSMEERRALVTQYSKAALPTMVEVQSLERAPVPYVFKGEAAPTYQKCATETGKRRLPANFFELVRKRIVLIDDPEPKIWIVPSLKGNVSRFLQFLKLIPTKEDGSFEPSQYVICTGSFFSTTKKEDNFLLYHQFLLKKLKNMNTLFCLNHLTDDFVTASCEILRSLYSADTLRSPENQEKPLSTFFEPDIVVFKGPQIILKNSELPVQKEDPSVKLSKLLTLPKFTLKSFLITPARESFDRLPSDDDTSDPPESRYFFLAFNRNILKEIKQTTSVLKCPPGFTCSGFKGGYKLSEAGDDRKIETPGLYLIQKKTEDTPFLKKEDGGPPPPLPPPPGGPEGPEGTEEPELPKAPKVMKEVKPFEAEELAKPEEEPFEASAKAAATDTTLTVDLNGFEYRLRIPYNPAVKEDWLKGLYTDGEAEFLNAMQMTPRLLSDAFGTQQWKPKLTAFLEKITQSNCFKDTTLLTHTECSTAQQFVKRVYLELYSRTLKGLYETFGLPTPEALEDIVAALRRLGRVGPTKGKKGLRPQDFTGDVLGRFALIFFDETKGEYFVDLAEMSDEVRKILEKAKLLRIVGKDREELSQAIYKLKQIPPPLPPSPPPGPDLYTLEDILSLGPVATDFFERVSVDGDGLCFYRTVLKGLMEDPPSDSGSVYVPSEDESLEFVRTIKAELQAQKKTLMVQTNANTEEPVDSYFTSQFGPKPGEPDEVPLASATKEDRNSRIRIGDVYKHMTFDEYVEVMDKEDEEERPYAEVQTAGIGIVTAELVKKVLIFYHTVTLQGKQMYNHIATYNEELAEKGLPLDDYLFIEFVGNNHYQLLIPKEPDAFPKQAGGGYDSDEVFDLGEPITETFETSY